MKAATPAGGWGSLFRTAFERSASPMLLLSLERVVVAVNDAYVSASGYQRADVVGTRVDRFVAPSSFERMEADWVTIRRTGRVMGDREWIRADGSHVSIQFAAQKEMLVTRALVLVVVLALHAQPFTRDCDQSKVNLALTPRELEVVSEIALGRRTRQIGEDLFISPNTVRTHVRNAMDKVGARTQAQLVAIALTQAMLDPERVNRAA